MDLDQNVTDRMAAIASKAETKRAAKKAAETQAPVEVATETTATPTEPTAAVEPTNVEKQPIAVEQTETKEAKPKKGKIEKFWDKKEAIEPNTASVTEPASQPSKEYEDWKKKAEQWDALQSDISFVALQKSRAEGKDLLTIANELSMQDPSKLKNEDIFRLILNDAGYTDQDEIEAELDEFRSMKPYKQMAEIEGKKNKLQAIYNQNIEKFKSEYTPREVADQNNLRDFQKAIEDSRGKTDFGGTLQYDQAALDKAMQAVEKATPQETLRAFALLGNMDIVFKNVYEAGMNEVLENEIDELRGSTERGVKNTPVVPKDNSPKAAAKKLVSEIRTQHQALGLKTASINQ